jgi:hypothetical protein
MDGDVGFLTKDLGDLVLATGALGVAAFGIVEGLKWTRLGLSGFRKIEDTLGADLMGAFQRAYGDNAFDLLKAQYGTGRGTGDLPRTLRQGARIGLSSDNVANIGYQIGVVDIAQLAAVVGKLEGGTALDDQEKSILGRFELAVDARIDAGLALAERSYRGAMRRSAFALSLFLAFFVTWVLDWEGVAVNWLAPFIVGITAVPLAPIAKDVSKAIQSATKAVRAVR